MPRRPRCYQPHVPCHVIQRGNNRQRCFFGQRDYLRYLAYLQEASRKYGCAIHSYVLMPNHVHLLATPVASEGISLMMQSLGRCYVEYINRTHARSGTLWEGRHKASLVDSERYWYVCARYIEMNPVRAGMVGRPSDYRWSSHRCNAEGRTDPLVTPHGLYQALGEDAEGRQRAYRELFADPISSEDLDLVRAAAKRSLPIGAIAKGKGRPLSALDKSTS